MEDYNFPKIAVFEVWQLPCLDVATAVFGIFYADLNKSYYCCT